jgi:hypothetical protein
MAYVYKHIRKDTNEVFYIGIGELSNRMTSKNNRNKYWFEIADKFDYFGEILEDNLDWATACEREKYWINYYGRKDLNLGTLVNLTDGGNGGANRSKETIKQIIESRKWYRHSEETKQKISKSNTGKTCWNKGKKNIYSKESRIKMSESHIGVKKSEESKKKMSIAKKNMTDETKKKISNWRKKNIVGDKNPSSIKCIDLESNKIFDSIKEMSFELDISYHKLYYLIYNSKNNKRFKLL